MLSSDIQELAKQAHVDRGEARSLHDDPRDDLNAHTSLLSTILDNFPGGIAVYDNNLRMIMCNDQLRRLLDYPDELFADGYPTLEEVYRCNAIRGEYGPGDIEEQVSVRLACARRGVAHQLERERPNGTVLEIRGMPLPNGGFVSVYHDVTEQRQQAKLLQSVVDNFPGGISVFDKDLQMVLCNKQQRQLLNYPDSLFLSGNPSLEDVFRFNASRGEYGPGDVEELVSVRMALARQKRPHCVERSRPNGVVLEIRGVPLDGGGFVSTYLDVTESRQAQARVAHMAFHDPLTDLPNRALFGERLSHDLARVTRGEVLALHYLDLDKFKPVNDTFGHDIGDQLLKCVAARLVKCLRETDTVARLGGDEFVVTQVGIEKPGDACVVAERIVKALTAPFQIDGHQIHIGTSIGIALAPVDGRKASELLKNSDSALYEAKARGRGSFRFFNAAIQQSYEAEVTAGSQPT